MGDAVRAEGGGEGVVRCSGGRRGDPVVPRSDPEEDPSAAAMVTTSREGSEAMEKARGWGVWACLRCGEGCQEGTRVEGGARRGVVEARWD